MNLARTALGSLARRMSLTDLALDAYARHVNVLNDKNGLLVVRRCHARYLIVQRHGKHGMMARARGGVTPTPEDIYNSQKDAARAIASAIAKGWPAGSLTIMPIADCRDSYRALGPPRALVRPYLARL